MRHRKSGRKLGRTASHRKATLANLATALFENISIKTTLAKAKEARGTVERLITFAKRGDLHARRQVARTIRDRSILNKLFEEIAPKYADRNGGYTRIINLGQRHGDGAELAIFELVGYEGVQREKIEKQRARREAKEKKKEAELAEEEAPLEAAEEGKEGKSGEEKPKPRKKKVAMKKESKGKGEKKKEEKGKGDKITKAGKKSKKREPAQE